MERKNSFKRHPHASWSAAPDDSSGNQSPKFTNDEIVFRKILPPEPVSVWLVFYCKLPEAQQWLCQSGDSGSSGHLCYPCLPHRLTIKRFRMSRRYPPISHPGKIVFYEPMIGRIGRIIIGIQFWSYLNSRKAPRLSTPCLRLSPGKAFSRVKILNM